MIDFKNKYDRAVFLDFLQNQLLPDDFEIDETPLQHGRQPQKISKITRLGFVKSLGKDVSNPLKVYEIEHDSENDPRVSLTKEAFLLLSDDYSSRSLVIFKSNNSDNYRFSLMTIDLRGEGKKVKKQLSNPRRFSFYLGPDAKVKTPSKFLFKAEVKDFEDLLSRFSIEVVNKEFYQEVARFFYELVGGQIKISAKKEVHKRILQLPSVDDDNNRIHQEFAIRLIGRIIFCWFLKQKKSANGTPLLPESLLSSKTVKTSTNYYHSVLEKIFFEALNKEGDTRNSDLTEDFSLIPFLNGGLFDPHHEDFYDDSPNEALVIPDGWFNDIFSVLETYNFTIDENTIADIDLSVDPEMLGRIFENLLAEVNPETGDSARKSTGSYYTPREIVEYMVDQSLINFLSTKTGISEDKLEALVSYDEEDDKEKPLMRKEITSIIEALDEMRIIDPACGSGAFPIGMLQKIMMILQRIDPKAKLWFEKKIEGIDTLIKEEFIKRFESENFDYIRKSGIIRDSIYGVDIQPIAVEVSKLRCFLTLVVDEEIDDEAANRGIEPLPNLEFKFMAANTLRELPEANTRQAGLFEDHDEIKMLKDVRDAYFKSSGIQKEKLKTDFYRIKNQMSQSQILKAGQGKLTMALAEWDPFSQKSSSWFDSGWMLGINDFDVVIGNPPYLRVQGIDKKASEEYKKIFKTATGRYDLYVLFVEKSLSLINKNGIANFIMPHKWLNSSFGAGLREIAKDKISKLISFKEYQVFNASTYTSLVWFKRSNTVIKYVGLNKDLQTNTALADFLASISENDYSLINNSMLQKEAWTFSDQNTLLVLNKLRMNPLTVNDVFEKVMVGIQTMGDHIFYLEGKIEGHRFTGFSKALNCNVILEPGIVKQLLKGDMVKRYAPLTSNIYVIYPHYLDNGKTKPFEETVFKEKYPLAYKYLSGFKTELIEKKIKYKANTKYWYALHCARQIQVFEHEKLITPEISLGCNLTLDLDNYYSNTQNYSFVKNNHVKESYYYYLAILNSKVLWFYLRNTGTVLANGYFRFKTEYLNPFPLPNINSVNDTKSLESLVKRTLELKKIDSKTDTSAIEDEIDQIVYKLYGLNDEDINIVEMASNLKQGRNVSV